MSVSSERSSERRRHVIGLIFAIGGLHVLGFSMLLALVIPQHLALASGGVFGLSLGLTAYTLGMRHAFDADHISAIDNSTRKLMGEGKESIKVGFYFSLGHSTVVVALGLLVALGVRGIGSALENDDSTLHHVTGVWGPTVAGLFLLLVGALNFAALVNIARVLLRVRRDEQTDPELETLLANRGVMNRIYKRATQSITRPAQMYPVGVLFGFGFDTATEIALLLLAGGAAASGLPIYAVMCLPILFTAGMTLFDTLNSVFMNFAYGWALERPLRKLYYNFTVTAISVVTAVAIGSISLAGVLSSEAGFGGVFAAVGTVDLSDVGYAIIGVFAAVWAIAVVAWRAGREQTA